MKLKLGLIALTLFISAASFAQKKPGLIGLHYMLVDNSSPKKIDTTSFSNVWKSGDLFDFSKMATAFSISYLKGIAKNFDVSLRGNAIFYDYAAKAGRTTDKAEYGAELEASLNFHPWSDAHFFTPYLNFGLGGGHYTDKWGAFVPVGLGLQFNVNNAIYFLVQSQYRESIIKAASPSSFAHSAGVAFNISKDRKVVVPVVEIPVVTDRDNDGVVDSLDACPDTPGLAALQGCPDRDGDGIADKDDKCPDVAGLAKYQGCPIPDTDGDGINDELDKCPTVAGVARYQGCPIPDTDNDGVNDEEDKCPNEAGPASNFGCPVIEQAIIERVNVAAKNIFFATGSAKLLAKSYPSLNNVVKVMTENPTFKIDIEGHTDSTGSAALNRTLSQNRANSVLDYLKSKGVDESRMTAAGFGPDRPIAPNKTPAGRAKNRRVEMKLRNY